MYIQVFLNVNDAEKTIDTCTFHKTPNHISSHNNMHVNADRNKFSTR